jgi:hypothetical protein
MRGLAAYLAAGGLLVLALDFMAPPVGIGLSIAAWPTFAGATTQHDGAVQYVDRTHKGNRLRLPTTTVEQRPAPVRHAPGVPIGCDPVFSPLSAAAQLNFPGRCIASVAPGSRAPA